MCLDSRRCLAILSRNRPTVKQAPHFERVPKTAEPACKASPCLPQMSVAAIDDSTKVLALRPISEDLKGDASKGIHVLTGSQLSI
jgi:hypothetical protein